MASCGSNDRIIKNTLMLYFRMIFLMIIYFYTSRIIINALGFVDYGIYSVVGGVVMMMSVFDGAMTSATQRFLAFELGKSDYIQFNRVFSATLIIHFGVALITLILAETIGLWFIHTQLNIPVDRVTSAYWVYHFAVLSFLITIMRVPYSASIVAHEQMSAYAYICVLEASLSLIIVFLLQRIPCDKLKLFAALTFLSTLLIALTYRLYCKIMFQERCIFSFYWDNELFHKLLTFSGWNFLGITAGLCNTHGSNILLNLFFTPAVNAARSISFQINIALQSFYTNFHSAVKPQIIKSFASDSKMQMINLVYQSSKYSYFLLFFFSLPILFEPEWFLSVWLKSVPNFAATFCRLAIINSLINCISEPVATAAQASGKVKTYQIRVQSVTLMNLPISYILFRIGYGPEVSLYVSIILSVIALFVRLAVVKGLIGLSIRKFIEKAIISSIFVTLLSIFFPLIFRTQMEAGFLRTFAVAFSSVFSTLLAILVVGLEKNEKAYIFQKFQKVPNFLSLILTK